VSDHVDEPGSLSGPISGISSLHDSYDPLHRLYPVPYGAGVPPVHPLAQVNHPLATIQHRLLHDPLAHLKPIDPNWGNY
jgi:hypothetical protein